MNPECGEAERESCVTSDMLILVCVSVYCDYNCCCGDSRVVLQVVVVTVCCGDICGDEGSVLLWY